jgi:CDP-glucose 4,6-dehydratase
VTVAELTESILEVWERPQHPRKIEHSSLHEAEVLRLDIAKACSLMSWRSRLGGRETLAWTVRWYKDYYQNPANAVAATREQIQSFAELMDFPQCQS